MRRAAGEHADAHDVIFLDRLPPDRREMGILRAQIAVDARDEHDE